jgi:hypothetical protein
MCGPIINKIKFCILYAKKNKNLGQKLLPTINLIGEQLLPNYLDKRADNFDSVNGMHDLMFLLA